MMRAACALVAAAALGACGAKDRAPEGEGWTAYAPIGGCHAQPVVDRELVDRLRILREPVVPRMPPPSGLRTDVLHARVDWASTQVAATDTRGRRLYVYLVEPEAGRRCELPVGLVCVRLSRPSGFGPERCVTARSLDDPGFAHAGGLAFGIVPDGVERVRLDARTTYAVHRNVWWGPAPHEPHLVLVD